MQRYVGERYVRERTDVGCPLEYLPPMASNLESTSSSSVPQLVELSLAEYQTYGASIGCGRDGTTFAFTIGPISDAIAAALESVAQARKRICLYCCGEPLLLDLVAVERRETRQVRIVGRVVGASSLAIANTVSDEQWGLRARPS